MTTPTGVQIESAENQVTEYPGRGDEPTEREPLIGGKLEALSQSQLRRDQEGVQSELAENQVTEDAAHEEREPMSDHSSPSSGTEEEIRSRVTSRPVKDKEKIARAKASRHIPRKLRLSQKTDNTNVKQDTSRGGLEPTTEPDESSVPRPPGSESKSDSSVPREEEKETKVKKFKFKKPN